MKQLFESKKFAAFIVSIILYFLFMLIYFFVKKEINDLIINTYALISISYFASNALGDHLFENMTTKQQESKNIEVKPLG
jgi:hypothetical protein